GDHGVAERELGAGERANYDAVCYHAQQCVEKLMKAVLVHRGVVPPKVHDLLHLAKLLRDALPSWDWSREDLRWLTRAGTAFRYPGGSAEREHAEKAFRMCTKLRPGLIQLVGDDRDNPARH
ncbi:MAG: HEPN domain-containing protein, partial [Planctomycetes bacterium]|nr:HEPN domain-containing protein [Planctomycetota bacterium]